MGWFSSVTSVARRTSGLSLAQRVGGKAAGVTGMAGKVVPGVPRAVSGTMARAIPSPMRAPAPAMGLVDRIQAARGTSLAVAKAEQAAGRRLGFNPNFRFVSPRRAARFW